MSPTIQLNSDQKGLFILPGETASLYTKRTEPFLEHAEDDVQHKKARNRVQELFDIDPVWVRVTYSNKDLYPWEGACLWYDEVPSIQLRKSFIESDRIFGFYHKDEILAHEYVHAVRACFGQAEFEEMLAYATSGPVRGFLGPLFDAPRDSLLVVAVFTLITVSALATVTFENAYAIFVWLSCFGTVLLGFLFFRLVRKFCQFRRCLKRLSHICPKPLSVMIRLTDEEIKLFSELSVDDSRVYVNSLSDYRWTELKKRFREL